MDYKENESKPLAIRYCLFSAFAACCASVFAVIGISLVTQKRFKNFSNTITIIGIFFLTLSLLSTVLTIVFRRIYKYHYNRNLFTSHRTIYRQVNRKIDKIDETDDL